MCFKKMSITFPNRVGFKTQDMCTVLRYVKSVAKVDTEDVASLVKFVLGKEIRELGQKIFCHTSDGMATPFDSFDMA